MDQSKWKTTFGYKGQRGWCKIKYHTFAKGVRLMSQQLFIAQASIAVPINRKLDPSEMQQSSYLLTVYLKYNGV